MNHETRNSSLWIAGLTVALLLSSAAHAETLPLELLTTSGTLLTLEWEGSEAGAASKPGSEVQGLRIVLREDDSSAVETWEIPAPTGERIELVGLFEHEELDLIFVVWEGWTPAPQGPTTEESSASPGDSTRLHIAAHDGREWVANKTLPESGAAAKGSLDVAVTRTANLDGSLSAVLHVAWSSRETGGLVYLPLVLDEQLNVVQPFTLTDLLVLPEVEASNSAALNSNSASSSDPISTGATIPVFSESSDLGFVHMGLSDGQGSSLHVFRIEPLPEEIQTLADDARAQISIMGATLPSREELAAEMRTFVFERARRLHPALQSYVSHRVELLVSEWEESLDSQGLERLGSDARAQISIMGSRIGPGGLDTGADLWLLESLGASVPSHLLSALASWRCPEEVPADAELMMSGDGRRVLLAWETETGVDLVFGADSAWSEIGSLEGTALDARLRRLLQRRVEWSSDVRAAVAQEE